MSFIHHITIRTLAFPLEKPFSNHLYQLNEIHALEIRIYTKHNYGSGFIYGLRKEPYHETIAYIKQELLTVLLAIKDITTLKSAWHQFWLSYKHDQTDYHPLTGLAIVDIAVWDLYCKYNHISLHHYLGAAKASVPVYGTTGWLSLSPEQLIEECLSYQAHDIHAFKLRIGHDDDHHRVTQIRKTMGNNFILMLDANRRYSPQQAEDVSRLLSPFNILWLEEPTAYIPDEMMVIKAQSKIPIALGENMVSLAEIEHACREKLTDYIQLDLPRCGGITGFIAAADIAKRYAIPLCSHLMPQLSASLVAGFANGAWVEYDNLLPPYVFIADFSTPKGVIQPPNMPGHGVELTQAALDRYTTSLVSIED